ncbi:MAG: hypothetical protein P8M72_09625 [Gammaproteobacteria bacterium]|nr:hypothetical protein [Gammaproteobacteria bacterium]
MLNYINKINHLFWEIAKCLFLILAVSVLTSSLFGEDIPFFGGILTNVQNVVQILGSEGLGVIIATIIIFSILNKRSA